MDTNTEATPNTPPSFASVLAKFSMPRTFTQDYEPSTYVFDQNVPVPIDCVYGYIPDKMQFPSTSLTLAAMYHTGTFVWGDPGDTGHNTSNPDEYAERMVLFVPGAPFHCSTGFQKSVTPRYLPFGENTRFVSKLVQDPRSDFTRVATLLLEYHDDKLVTVLVIEGMGNLANKVAEDLGIELPQIPEKCNGFAKFDLRDGTVTYWYENHMVAAIRANVAMFDRSMFKMNTVSEYKLGDKVAEIDKIKQLHNEQTARIFNDVKRGLYGTQLRGGIEPQGVLSILTPENVDKLQELTHNMRTI